MVRRLLLVMVSLLYTAMAVTGITWGLPSSRIDRFLFPEGDVWTGEKIFRLAQASRFGDSVRGADVDVNPLREREGPIHLTETPEDIAAIYLRYRLYTHQPDEMITLRALAGMRPRQLQLDPRLYQYGGLFIYPVGALIGACGAVGWMEVTSDLSYYLDHPDEFGKFYIVARAYVGAWGFVGLLLVYAITCRLADWKAALFAVLLYTCLPVVVCMSHEAKPHLPGAVLMLLAVWLAMRATDATFAERSQRRNGWFMCVACGAAQGMVLSSLPIFVLIPLTAWMRRTGTQTRLSQRAVYVFRDTVVGILIAFSTYLITNPYVGINLIANRDVLRSNLANSTAMYEIGRLGEGFVRASQLTAEGATWPVFILGFIALVGVLCLRNRRTFLLALPALCVFTQFVMLGAGKPDEYGRFSLFVVIALTIGTAALFGRLYSHDIELRIPISVLAVLTYYVVAVKGSAYLSCCYVDTQCWNSRLQAADFLRQCGASGHRIAFMAEPAPYNCPPVNFAHTTAYLLSRPQEYRPVVHGRLIVAVETGVHRHVPAAVHDSVQGHWDYFGGNERTAWYETPRHPDRPITWANQTIAVFHPAK